MTKPRTKFPANHPFRYDFPATAEDVLAWSEAGTLSPPDEIAGLTAAALDQSISLAWGPVTVPEHPAARPITSVVVERSIDGGGYATIATLAANARSYDDISLTNDLLHEYRVTAINDVGTSTPSAANATPVASGLAAAAPEGIHGFTARDGYQVHLTPPKGDGAVEFEFEVDSTSQGLTPYPFIAPEGLSGTHTYSVRGRGRNSAGDYGAWSDVIDVTVSPDLPPLGDYALSTTAEYKVNGVTEISLTFDRPVPVFYDVNGFPMILSDRSFEIIDCFPACEPDSGGFLRAGVQQDPWFLGNQLQGLDERNAKGVEGISYEPSLNIAPSLASNPAIRVPQGTQTVYVKSSPNENATGQPFKYWAWFTIVATKYAEDAFVPPVSSTEHLPWVFERDIDLNCLQKLANPVSNQITIQEALDDLPLSRGEYAMGIDIGDNRNSFVAFETGGPAHEKFAGINYQSRIKCNYALHANWTDAEKRPLVQRLIMHGINIASSFHRGWTGTGGSGQENDRHPALWTTYFLTGDDRIGDAARRHHSTMQKPAKNGNIFYVNKGDLDTKSIASTNRGRDKVFPYPPEALGAVYVDQSNNGVPINGGYNIYAWASAYVELLPCLLLKNSPNGLTGAQEIMRRLGGTDDTVGPSNPTSSPIAAMFVAPTFRPLPSANWPSQTLRDYNAAWVGETGLRYSGLPTAPDQSRINFAASADGITFNLNDIGYATESPHYADLYYSIDRRQRAIIEDVPKDGFTKITLPTNCKVWPYIGVRSASGSSALYQSRKADDSFTPTGKPANAAPSFVGSHTPVITYDHAPSWPGIDGRHVGADQLDNVVEFICGSGIVSGYPAPVYPDDWTFTPIWGGVEDVPNLKFKAPYSAMPMSLQWKVRVKTSQGFVEAFSNEIIIPGIPALPEGVLIDTDFKRYHERAYGLLFAQSFGIRGNILTLSDRPYKGSTSPGHILHTKESKNPILRHAIGVGVSGQQYQIETEMIFNKTNSNTTISVVSGPNRVDLDNISKRKKLKNDLQSRVYTFTCPPALDGQMLGFDMFHRSGRGGNAGGRIGMTRLKVFKI